MRRCAYDVGVPRARARTRRRRTRASSAQLGMLFRLGGHYASFQIARFQRIIEAPPEPSLCASEVLPMLVMRFSQGLQNVKSRRTAGERLSSYPQKKSVFPMPSHAPLTRNAGPLMESRGHWRRPGKQALASVPPHRTMTAQAGFWPKIRAPDLWKLPHQHAVRKELQPQDGLNDCLPGQRGILKTPGHPGRSTLRIGQTQQSQVSTRSTETY